MDDSLIIYFFIYSVMPNLFFDYIGFIIILILIYFLLEQIAGRTRIVEENAHWNKQDSAMSILW